VVVALPPGATLSAEDRASIESYLLTKWNCNIRRPAGDSQAPSTPQPGPYSPPSDSSFININTNTLSTDGGGSSPLILTQSPQTTNNIAMKLLPIPTSAATFTTLLNFTTPYVTDTNAGIALFNNQTGTILTFGIHYQNIMAGSFQFNHFNSPSSLNSSLTTEQRRWYISEGREVWLRVVINSTSSTLIFLASQTGRENTWDVLFTSNNEKYIPNLVGYYVDAYASKSISEPVSLIISHQDSLHFTSAQATAGPYNSQVTAPSSQKYRPIKIN
jgi:hypothetical protein